MIKRNFIKLSLIQKIEIYLLVIMFYGVIIYQFDNIYPQQTYIIDNLNINTTTIKDFKELKKRIVKKENTILLKLLEEKSEELMVFIVSTKNQKEFIDLEFYGKFLDIMNFLNYIQNHFTIKKFQLLRKERNMYCNIEIDTKYFYNQNKINNKLHNIANPFVNNKDPKVYKKNNNTLKVIAIIASNILIDDKWYQKNDIINNQKIILVNNNSVEFLNKKTNKKYILKVHNDK
jgi:hypothetical protein